MLLRLLVQSGILRISCREDFSSERDLFEMAFWCKAATPVAEEEVLVQQGLAEIVGGRRPVTRQTVVDILVSSLLALLCNQGVFPLLL